MASEPNETPPPVFSRAHLDVPVGQQQVDDDVRGEQLHAVQPLLDALQLLVQVPAAETLPRHPDLLPDGLPEVLATADRGGVVTPTEWTTG